MEVYDRVSGKWNAAVSMSTPRYQAAVISLCGSIFVFGGLTAGSTALATGERFDVVSGVWTPIASSTIARHDHSVVAVSDTKCWLLGGLGARYEDLDVVEEYDVKTNSYTVLSTSATSDVRVKLPTPLDSIAAHYYRWRSLFINL